MQPKDVHEEAGGDRTLPSSLTFDHHCVGLKSNRRLQKCDSLSFRPEIGAVFRGSEQISTQHAEQARFKGDTTTTKGQNLLIRLRSILSSVCLQGDQLTIPYHITDVICTCSPTRLRHPIWSPYILAFQNLANSNKMNKW